MTKLACYQEGCPRLPVTAARSMRWLMVRAVIELLLEMGRARNGAETAGRDL
jgi:hypothetical protein